MEATFFLFFLLSHGFAAPAGASLFRRRCPAASIFSDFVGVSRTHSNALYCHESYSVAFNLLALALRHSPGIFIKYL